MYYFIVNEHGGSGKAVSCWQIVKQTLDSKNIQYKFYIPEYAGHATELARQISEQQDNDIRLVVVGGDGTVNEVLNGITSFERIKFGLVPTGSGNDFSRGLNIPRHNPAKALDLILNSPGNKAIDLGCVEALSKRKFFGISSGYGMDAIVGTSINTSKIKVVMNKLHLSKMSYGLLTVVTLFRMNTYRVKLSFDGEPLKEFSKMIFIATMNFPWEGGGVPMTPLAKGDDGQLSVCVAYGIPKWRTFLLFPFLLLAKHANKKGFYIRNCKTLDIFSEDPTVCHTDGELLGSPTRIHYECLPKKLTVLV